MEIGMDGRGDVISVDYTFIQKGVYGERGNVMSGE